MEYLQILLIVFGFLAIILSVFNFLHFNSSILISNHIRKFLSSESERIQYQRSTAMPQAMLGLITLILGVFCYHNVNSFLTVYFGDMCIFIVWMSVINKKYLGSYFPYSHRK